MNYRIMLFLNAIVVVLFGGFLLIQPQTALTLFGVDVYVSTLMVTRFLGGAMLMSGILIWFIKDVTDQSMQKNVGFALLGGSVVGFALGLIGMTSAGVIRTNGWILLVIAVIFSMGYAFMLFSQTQGSTSGGYQKQV